MTRITMKWHNIPFYYYYYCFKAAILHVLETISHHDAFSIVEKETLDIPSMKFNNKNRKKRNFYSIPYLYATQCIIIIFYGTTLFTERSRVLERHRIGRICA